MTQAPTLPRRMFRGADLRRLIIPLVLEQALAVSVGLLDSLMISGVGDAAVSGVSLVDMINAVIISVFAALATGGAVVASQHLGGGRTERARQCASQLLFVVICLSALITVPVLFCREQLLRLLFGSIESDVMGHAMDYFFFTALSFPFIAVYNCCAALFRTMGNSKISMIASLASNGVNLLGNALLIYLVGLGAAGAAIATLIARGVAMLILLVLLCQKKNAIHLRVGGRFRPDFRTVGSILRIGIPSGVENSIFYLGRLLVVSIISTFGTVQITANAVANTMDSAGCIVGHGMNLAMITVIGQCVGAGDREQLHFYLKDMMKRSYLYHVVWNIALGLATYPILLCYQITPESRILAGILILIHNGCGLLLWPVSFVFPNALRAANDVRFTMIASVASMIILRIGFSFLLGVVLGWGAIGVWCAMVADWLCRITCFWIRYKTGAWLRGSGLPSEKD